MGVNQEGRYSQNVGRSGSGREPISEWWWYPENPDSRDEEFEAGPGLPAGYAWWADTGTQAALIPHAAVNNVKLASNNVPTVVNYKIGAAASGGRRRSWMQCQVPLTGTGGSADDPRAVNGFYLLKPYSPTADGCTWTRCTFPLNWLSGGSGVAGPMMYFVIMGQTAGVPDRNTMLMVGGQGQTNTGGNMNTNCYAVSGTTSSIIPLGAGTFSQGGAGGFGIRRRTSVLWQAYQLDPSSINYRQFVEFNQSLIAGNFTTFTPVYSGWKFYARTAQGYNPLFGTDFHRFSTDADTLPL